MQTLDPEVNKRINSIHYQYVNIVSPLIIKNEVLTGEFPIEILNEIRAIFGHLSKVHLQSDTTDVDKNLFKAESHVKRAILDCFKYLCLAYDDKYYEFDRRYKNVDLSDIDNGNFLPQLCRKRKEAVDRLSDAKKKEIDAVGDDDLYDAYEIAYNAYMDVHDLLDGAFEKMERLKRKVSRSYLFGVIGIVLGVVGIIATIVTYLMK